MLAPLRAVVNTGTRFTIAAIAYGALISILSAVAIAQSARPEILRISPTSGPEGLRVEVTGNNLQETSAVFFGSINSSFTLVSPQELIALVPQADTAIADVVHRLGDVQEVLEELGGNVFVNVIVTGQLERDAHHVQ